MLLRPIVLVCVLAAQPALCEPFVVSVVPSDDTCLPAPVPRDQELSAAQVLDMVRTAVDLIGGMAAVVPDTARLVVIKPNIVTDEPSGSGVVTDTRVVRAVALLVHEVAPSARLLIAEGAGGWISPALKDCTSVTGTAAVVDGFAVAGHRATVEELRGLGIDIDCFDLNFDRPRALQVPGGGLARDEYDLAATILGADAWINCPIAKTHGAKITCCMKNHIGLLPGTLYGWSKFRGVQKHPGIPHAPRVIDELLVDLWTLTKVDLNVVDMICGTEGGAFQGRPKRSNLIVAGRDPVATDLVVSRLMGFNPDDFEFADLAWQRGMGPGRIENVEVRGGKVEDLTSRFKKAGVDYGGSEWREQANYGMGPRRLTLLGPLPADHAFSQAQVAGLACTPGQGGWSPGVWFGHDKIDLDQYLDDPTNCSAYAFTYFTMARADSVRFWAGSDEDLEVWIDGQRIYQHQGPRRHRLGTDQQRGYLAAGDHRLLVRAGQTWGGYDFSFNICEPIDDELYAGNRYPGVRYYLTPDLPRRMEAVRVRAEDYQDSWITPYFASNLSAEDPVQASRKAPDSLVVSLARQPAGRDLLAAAAAAAGLTAAHLDTQTLVCLSTAPFGMEFARYRGLWPEYGPEPGRPLSWLGLQYDIRTGVRYRETLKAIRGWLAGGRTPVIGFGPMNWSVVTGSKGAGAKSQIQTVGADTSAWMPVTEDWWAPFPGEKWHNCPLVVVEQKAPPLSEQALADSVAGLALEMGLQPFTESDPQPWGTRRFPAGLAGWDAWVVEWERLPLTREWAQNDKAVQRYFSELRGEESVLELARKRRRAADYFGRAAASAGSAERVGLLRQAAGGYGEVARTLEELSGMLPKQTGESPNEEDARLLDGLPGTRTLVRRARAAERQALEALVSLLGRPPLPPAAEDPLRLKERGMKLYTWRAESNKGMHDLSFGARQLRQVRVTGKDAEGVSQEVHHGVPEKPGWQVAVEVIRGAGFYTVLQQPAADNHGTVVLRVDDSRARDNSTELVVWALPAGD